MDTRIIPLNTHFSIVKKVKAKARFNHASERD